MPWDIKDALLDLLLPRICACCETDLPQPLSGPLCGPCLKRLKPLEHAPLDIDGLKVWAAFAYRSPVPELLYAFKYRCQMRAGRALADWMAGISARLPLGSVDAVVPVPLHPGKFHEREFNQAEILALPVAKIAKAPVAQLLWRVRRTKPQWRLNRKARARNLSDAFKVHPDVALQKNTPLLLIDDVCTTGGTLEGCARALREAGYKNLKALVLAQD